MKTTITHEKYGTIYYEESFWTGKKEIYLNGKKLQQISKICFILVGEEKVEIYIEGNAFKGVNLIIDGQAYEITEKTKWYEYIVAIIPAVITFIWGNSVALCKILPIVGGVIGGALCGLGLSLAIIMMKKTKNVGLKILIGLGIGVLTFLICFLVAQILLSSL